MADRYYKKQPDILSKFFTKEARTYLRRPDEIWRLKRLGFAVCGDKRTRAGLNVYDAKMLRKRGTEHLGDDTARWDALR